MFSCPLCTRTGLLLFGIGFGILFLTILNVLPEPGSTWVGLGFIISAYIIPNVIKSKTCSDGSCGVTPKRVEQKQDSKMT